MIYIGAIIAVQFIILTAYWLYKKYNPQGVLLLTGIMMLTISLFMGLTSLSLSEPTGSVTFDLFKTVKETFSGNLVRVGLMIMTIGGYVSYMKHIKASDTLVYVSMQPLSLLRKYPYLAACSIVPIGQMLFICTPSAAGLGLLLSASILPVLVNLGVTRLTAASVISACTVFDMGPGSANTAKASELAEMNNVFYFVEHQLLMAIPMTLLLMLLYYFTNRYYDKKDKEKAPVESEPVKMKENFKAEAPLIYAVLPVLPLVLLIVFSKYIQLFNPPIDLDTTTAMFASLFVALAFELIRSRSLKVVFAGIKAFWDGMGKMFTSVITLIVAAEIFSKGLIGLGFIDALVEGSTHMGLSGAFIGIFITIIIFLAAMLMGSGNASFFSFGPLIPGIAQKFGMAPVDMILPMQLSSSMGRATSPIAGVIIAIADVAGVSPMDLAKRNLIPLGGTLLFMLIYNYAF
ncbi:C4-dicarboxylate transporter DcuC [Bacteroides sp. 51]|uniref:C4-dicarboxylate transporter DcuC n=1 Tax=Bacteroides sp. 51 TaxID=2302938 RepID=UPI0013D6E64B|nr:C4-dicarboxylate transporter DcuC [Bacteroides sp. 51]NDV80717.1 TRAP transporter large permease subunit [Bacteroides sp. 51]